MLDPRVLPYHRHGTFVEFMASIYLQLTIAMSMTTSCAIAACRFINIKYSFYEIKKLAVVIGCIIAATTYMSLIALLFSRIGKVNPHVVWHRYSVQTMYLDLATSQPTHTYVLFILMKTTRVVIVGTGVVISLMSVLQLSRIVTTEDSSRENIKKSSIVIAAMNIFNMTIVITNTVSHTTKSEAPLPTFLGSGGLYFIGAGFNPIIRILACKDVLKYCKSLLTLENILSAPVTSRSTVKFRSSGV